MKILIFCLAFVLIFPSAAFSENFNKDISGQGLGRYQGSEIFLSFNDGIIKENHIIINNEGKQEKIILKNPKIKFKNYGFLLVDDDRNFIIYKETKSGFKISSKIKLDDKKIRVLFNQITEKQIVTNQRDFLLEQQTKSDENKKPEIGKDSLQSKIQRNKDTEKQLEHIEKQELLWNNKLTSKGFEYIENQKIANENKKDDVISDTETKLSIPKMKIFLEHQTTQYVEQDYFYDLYLFDTKINKFGNRSFKTGIITNATITSSIKNPDDKIIHESTGTTGDNGYFSDSYFIPKNTKAGEYILTIQAEKKFNDIVKKDSVTEQFFISPQTKTEFNTLPVAVVNLPQIFFWDFVEDNELIVDLDGSQSHDPDDSTLTYTWTFENARDGFISILNGFDIPKPQIKIENVDDPEIFEFGLLINDGKKNSTLATTSVTAHNATLSISSGKLLNFQLEDETDDRDISDGLLFNVRIVDEKIDYAQMNATIQTNGTSYQIYDIDFINGTFNGREAVDVYGQNGILDEFE